MSDSPSHLVAGRTAISVGRFIRYLLALFLLLAAIPLAFGQHQNGSASLSGNVHDSEGNPAADALVELQSSDPAKTISTRTDAKGKYRFADLAPGVYSLSASLRDSSARVASLILDSKQAKVANLNFAPAKSSAPTMQPQFSDEPQFTVAGVKDTTNLGGHGSNVVAHTRNNLAKETASLGKPVEAESVANANESAKSLHERMDREPNNAEIHHQLARLEEQLGDPLEAVRQYQRAAELNPTEPYFFDWGSELLLHHAAEPAIEVFATGNHRFPRSVRMMLGLGAAHFALGSNDQAVREICEASDLNPSDPAPYVFLGRMLRSEKMTSNEAAEKLHRFVTLHPENAEASYYYAVVLGKQPGDPVGKSRASEVESLLNRAVTIDPKLAAAHLQLGIVYSERHDNARAIAAFQRAVQADPQMEEAHYRLAQVYRQLGEGDKSKKELQIYEQLSKESEQRAERERHDIRQFVYTLRDQPLEKSR